MVTQGMNQLSIFLQYQVLMKSPISVPHYDDISLWTNVPSFDELPQ